MTIEEQIMKLQTYKMYGGEDTVYVERDDVLKALEQEPKTGHWRHYEGMLTCSECGSAFYDDIMEYCGDDVPKYCPDCGRRMVEPQESEDEV